MIEGALKSLLFRITRALAEEVVAHLTVGDGSGLRVLSEGGGDNTGGLGRLVGLHLVDRRDDSVGGFRNRFTVVEQVETAGGLVTRDLAGFLISDHLEEVAKFD